MSQLFIPSYRQLEAIKIYRIFCNNCKSKVYATEGEMRFDFIERLKEEGWKIPNHYMTDRVLCPKCQQELIKSQRSNTLSNL